MAADLIPGHNDLIGVSSAILVPSAWDISFFLFEHENDGWKLRLVQQKYTSDEEHGLQENFACTFVDGPDAGGFFVVTAFNRPWPSSCMSGLEMLVLQPDRDPFQPKIIFHVDRRYSRCCGYRLSSAKNIVKLNYRTWNLVGKRGAGSLMLNRLDEYSITSGKVQRYKWKIGKNKIREIVPCHRLFW